MVALVTLQHFHGHVVDLKLNVTTIVVATIVACNDREVSVRMLPMLQLDLKRRPCKLHGLLLR